MKTRFFLCCLFVVNAGLFLGLGARADTIPGLALAVPEGFVVQPARSGVDGFIVKADTLRIRYEIGRIPKSGQPVMSGNFKNRAMQVGRGDKARWMKTENVNGQPGYFALDTENVLHASFPAAGVNFSVATTGPQQVDEALAVLRTFAAN
jgi:hypothetical protein